MEEDGGFPNGLTLSEDGDILNWRGENYVRQGVAEETAAERDRYRDMAGSMMGAAHDILRMGGCE